MKKSIIPSLIISSGMFVQPVSVLAQGGATAPETKNAEQAKKDNKDTDKKDERIEVTGSRIKRVDVEAVTPITVISRQEIDRSGVSNLAELLKKNNSSPTGNFGGDGLAVRSGAATVDLLGIGANRTLVLLDGKRLPVENSLGAVNVANIPISIVDRIEILNGGASAIYGTDAIGGVVNIITRKDFQGVEASVRSFVPQHGGGESFDVNALGGAEFGPSTSAFVYAGYTATREILQKNRDLKVSSEARKWTAYNAPAGGYSYRTIDDFGGDNETRNDYNPSANCPEGNKQVTNPAAPNDVYCAGLRADYGDWLTSGSKEYYFAGRINHELNDTSKLSAVALFDVRQNTQDMGNYLLGTQDPLFNQGVFISKEKADEFGIPGVQDGQVVELLANTVDMEQRQNNNKDTVYGGTVEFTTEMNKWNLQSGVSYFKTQNKRSFNNVLNVEKQIAIFHPRDNAIDPPYIPIDPNRDSGLLKSIYDDLKTTENTTSTVVDANISRELFELPAGKFQFLVGASVAGDKYEQIPDTRDQQFYAETLGEPEAPDGSNVLARLPLYEGTAGVSGNGSRSITSLYTEVVAPVFKGFEIDAALRADKYSDFGTATNYGIGAKYKLLDNLLLRGNAASSYKAPLLSMLHAEGGGGYVDVVDDRWTQREIDRGQPYELGSSHQIYSDFPGNKDLKEEKGKSYSVGLVYDPIAGLGLSADYYAVRLEGTQNTDSPQDLVDSYYAARDIGKNTVNVDSDDIVTTLKIPYQNMGELMVSAWDARLNYNTKLAGLNLGYDAAYFRYISYRSRDYTTSPIVQKVGYKGIPQWRYSNTASVGFSGQNVALSSLTIGRQQTDPKDIQPGREYHSVDQYTEIDASYSIELPTNTLVLVGVNNIMDTIGGRDTSGSTLGGEGVNTDLYSIQGRSYFAKVTQRF